VPKESLDLERLARNWKNSNPGMEMQKTPSKTSNSEPKKRSKRMKNFNKNSFLHNLWSKIARKREATCDKNCELLKMYEEIQRAVENPETKLRGIKQQYQKSQVHAGMVQ
jgi:hypothetical protein